MGLPWIRLDTTIADHPKMLDLAEDKAFQAMTAHMLAMAYAGKHGTDGFIPKGALPFIHGRKTDADRLVRVGLWVETPGGWQIHGWDEYQVSDDEAKARREKAQKAAAVRWGKER
ncbi:hypothetical protein [Prescottella equi]|uniref:hypothetical protein n=1 Tax=Rhodococcus hoagii TaxID=43767 RepID=UPI001EEB5F9E|nr:hypothetical protein [Prescottella equi]